MYQELVVEEFLLDLSDLTTTVHRTSCYPISVVATRICHAKNRKEKKQLNQRKAQPDKQQLELTWSSVWRLDDGRTVGNMPRLISTTRNLVQLQVVRSWFFDAVKVTEKGTLYWMSVSLHQMQLYFLGSFRTHTLWSVIRRLDSADWTTVRSIAGLNCQPLRYGTVMSHSCNVEFQLVEMLDNQSEKRDNQSGERYHCNAQNDAVEEWFAWLISYTFISRQLKVKK